MVYTFFVCLYLNVIHALADYSTYSRYGDTGTIEVIDYLKNKGIVAGNITTYPNLGSYLGMSKYYEITSVYKNNQTFKEKIIENNKINYMVIYKRDIARIGEGNMNYFYLDTKIGSYYVFKKKENIKFEGELSNV